MKQQAIYKGSETASRFRKITRWPLRILVCIGILAVVAPLIANELPLYVNYKGHTLFPVFAPGRSIEIIDPVTGVTERIQYDIADWKRIGASSIIFPPVPYSPGKSDLLNSDYAPPAGPQFFETKDGEIVPVPTRFRHWLGTGKTGDDVLAGLLHGTRVSFTVGMMAMLIASVIGIAIGSVAGYYGDYSIKIRRGEMAGLIAGILPAWFYGFVVRKYNISDATERSLPEGMVQIFFSVLISILILFLFFRFSRIFRSINWLEHKIPLPVDSIFSRIIEIFISLPRLLLIITLAAVTKPSFMNLVLIIGFTAWTDIARLTRAEFLRSRELDYITAARALGFSNARIIFRHALPNGIGPVLVTVAFGAAAAILSESGLSFLGIGVPQDVVTWGSLLAAGKENVNAWWLIVFPGLAVFTTVMIYNLLGEGLRKALQPAERIIQRP